jgi:hypothetical protein
MTEELKKVIINNRPKITESSVKTYVSMISNLYKKIHGKEKDFDYNYFLKNPDEVIEHLKNKPSKNRKTILSSLVVICGDDNKKACQKYRELMMEDAIKTNKENEKQKKTEKQADNWISYDEVKEVYNNLKKEVSPLLSKKDLSDDELQRLQNYIILSLYTDIAPRRLMDYTELKIRGADINKNEDNFLLKNKFVFNKYKTSKFYGTQEIDLPLKLKLLINKWLKINPTDYLLFDTKKQKLTPSKLNQRLNKIFGNKNISASMLRHIYISDEVLKDVPALEKLKKISEDMGHNLTQQMLYKKN